jgi:hypothetical protein
MKTILTFLANISFLSFLLFSLLTYTNITEENKDEVVGGLLHLDGYDPRDYSIGNEKYEEGSYESGKKRQESSDFCLEMNYGFVDSVNISRCFYKVGQEGNNIILSSDSCYLGGDDSSPELWDKYCKQDPGKYSMPKDAFAIYSGSNIQSMTPEDDEFSSFIITIFTVFVAILSLLVFIISGGSLMFEKVLKSKTKHE